MNRLDSAHLNVLRKLYAGLAGTDIIWAITGSVGLALHGVPVVPKDIDIQTDDAGVYVIERKFTQFVTRPVEYSAANRIRSHYGALTIDGITVELMGAVQKRRPDGTWEPAVDVTTHRHFLDVDGMCVPVLSLEHEIEAYRKLGRLERANDIERWLRESP